MTDRPDRVVGLKTSTGSSVRALVNVVRSLHHLAPGFVLVLLIIFASVIAVAALSAPAMIAGIVLFTLCLSLLIYATTENFGESVLALAAGLLAVVAVEWTTRNFLLFVAPVTAFALVAILMASLKIAAKTETLYRRAAVLSGPNYRERERLLRRAGRATPHNWLGPVERAEVVLQLSFRKYTPDQIGAALVSVELLAMATQISPKDAAAFIAELHRTFSGGLSVDAVLDLMQEVEASPAEFVAAFMKSRSAVLARTVTAEEFVSGLREGFALGLSEDEIAARILKT